MQDIIVTLIQTELHRQNPEANVEMLDSKINTIAHKTDLVVLPEMFNTSFITQPSGYAEKMNGLSFSWLKSKSAEKNCVIAGSLLIEDKGKFFNRFVWMEPDGKYSFYDKKHLFRFAGEDKYFKAGKDKIFPSLKGWKFFPIICYDIRFPVWCKNNYTPDKGYDYDAIIVVANWPETRNHSWRILLMARAIENMSYVIGVNRTGDDGNGLSYSGDSAVINAKGENISKIKPATNHIESIKLSRIELENFRDDFRVAYDWDKFKLLQHQVPS